MNFKRIQTAYPKGYFEWAKYLRDVEGVVMNDIAADLTRGMFYHELECFFDSVDIYISPKRILGKLPYPYYCKITTKRNHVWMADKASNRTEAKEAAFLKAFLIYEGQLKC